MKITLVIHTFNDRKGGKEIFTWNLVQHLLESGDRVQIVASNYDTIDHPDLSFHRVAMYGKALGLHRWTFARSSRRKVDALDSGLVYTNGKAGYGDVIRIGGLPLKSLLRVLREQEPTLLRKWWFDLRSTLSLSKSVQLRLEEQTFQETDFDRVIVASHLIKWELLRSYPEVPEDRVHVVYNGYDPDTFNLNVRGQHRDSQRRALELPDEASVLIFVSNNFHLKGIDRVIDYLRRHPDLRLIVVGRGKPVKVAPGVEERIRWVGEVEDVAPYYAASDALVFPTRADGFGLVVLEALAMGLYSMVSDRAGAAELIDTPWKGTVFSGTSMEEVDWQEVQPYLGEEAAGKRAQFASEYTWERVTDQYRDVFRQCS